MWARNAEKSICDTLYRKVLPDDEEHIPIRRVAGSMMSREGRPMVSTIRRNTSRLVSPLNYMRQGLA